MRILFCGKQDPDLRLGAMKHVMELAAALRELGHHCDVVGPAVIGADRVEDAGYPAALLAYLSRVAADYDVIDYGHEYLPVARDRFPSGTLMVARSVLLVHHLATCSMPSDLRFRPRVSRLVRGDRWRKQLRTAIRMAERTLASADLINLLNEDDRRTLAGLGHAREKLVVLPVGLTPGRRAALSRARAEVSAAQGARAPTHPWIGFVGTFDYRKGGPDLPVILERVRDRVPSTRLRLMGTRGLFRTATDVITAFPKRLRSHIDVVESFEPEALPRLLSDVQVGVFPSYVEGFGFGVLEMLGAGIPVIAYRRPGPPEMLSDELLVSAGDCEEVARRVARLLGDPAAYAEASAWALRRSADFDWGDIARRTADIYQERLDALRRRACRQLPKLAGDPAGSEYDAGASPPLNILMTVHHALDWNSGAAGSTLQLRKAYEELGNRVTIVSLDDLHWLRHEVRQSIALPWALVALYGMHQARNECPFDVIDSTTGDAWLLYTLLRHRSDRPLLVTRSTGLEHLAVSTLRRERDTGGAELSWRFPLWHGGAHLWEVGRSCRFADLVLLLNEYDRLAAVEKLDVRLERTAVVWNGVPTSLIGSPPPQPRRSDERLGVAFIGSALPRKGFRHAIDALAHVMSANPTVHAAMLGTGLKSADFERQFPRDLLGRVRHVPHYCLEQLPSLLRDQHILLCCSLTEGFGKAVVEGMACGLAPIVSDAEGPLEVIRQRENGVIVPRGNASHYARAIESLLHDPERHHQIRLAAHRSAQRVGWTTIARQRLAQYHRAIARRNAEVKDGIGRPATAR